MVFFGLVMAPTSATAIAMVSAGDTAFANGVSGNGLETNISSNLQIPSFWYDTSQSQSRSRWVSF